MATLSNSESVDESVLQGEIDLLQAIYFNELTLERNDGCLPHKVTACLHPATGDNTHLQYVTLTLELSLDHEYPKSPPKMKISNPRGLSDTHLNNLEKELAALATERRGGPMLFELIELAKESLTEGNVPYSQCVICLGDFGDNDAFTKTSCYHYFHDNCLYRFIQHKLKEFDQLREEAAQQKCNLAEEEKQHQVTCPICKEPLEYDLEKLQATIKMGEEEEAIVISLEIRQMQERMAHLFDKQKAQGGIIDLEEEQNKYRLQPGTLIHMTPQESVNTQSTSSAKMDITGNLHTENTKPTGNHDRDRQRPQRRKDEEQSGKKNVHSTSNGENQSSLSLDVTDSVIVSRHANDKMPEQGKSAQSVQRSTPELPDCS